MILVKKALPYVIMLGIFGYILAIGFGFNTLVTKITTQQGMTMYYLDIHAYLTNVSGIQDMTPPPFETLLPNREWYNDLGGLDVWFGRLVNNLAYLFDWMYMPINVILYLLRWIAYAMIVIFTCLGWPLTMTNGQYDSVLITIFNWLSQNLMIPYV